MGKAATRAGVVFVVLTAALYLAWDDIALMSWYGPMLALVFIAGVVVGWPVGHAVARKLTDDSGLTARKLILPVVGLVLVGELLACWLASLLRGGAMLGLVVPLLGLFLWSAVGCVCTLMFR